MACGCVDQTADSLHAWRLRHCVGWRLPGSDWCCSLRRQGLCCYCPVCRSGSQSRVLLTLRCARDLVHLAPYFLESMMQELTKIERNLVEKYFRKGDCVKVLSGQHEGETGMVVKVDTKHQVVTLISDLSQKAVALCVQRMNDLHSILTMRDRSAVGRIRGRFEDFTRNCHWHGLCRQDLDSRPRSAEVADRVFVFSVAVSLLMDDVRVCLRFVHASVRRRLV